MIPWQTALEPALATAREERKPVLLHFSNPT